MSIPPVRNDPSKVQLTRLGHIYYEHPDLDKFTAFAGDFGLVEAGRSDDGNTVYYRGYGPDPYVYVATRSPPGSKPIYGGPAFVARDQTEFDKATRIPGATISGLQHAPGGGQRVTVARPNGTFMHVVFGQRERGIGDSKDGKATVNGSEHIPTATHEQQGPYNTPLVKQRRGQFQRYHQGPALVHKAGHTGYVLASHEFEAELDFYTRCFNFVHSDVLWSPEDPEVDIITFMRLDLGDEYSDHHILFLSRGPPTVSRTYVHHTSFEVADFDTQLLGHQWLAKKGWLPVWGVGRHIEGSQIFDYWADPDGFNVEHYCDGDVLNRENETQRRQAGALSVWGPEIPVDFFDDKVQALA